jgi:hypothetical protein
MRRFLPVMFVGLWLVSGCKKKPLGSEGSQAQADADYVTSRLSTVCDGAKIPEAKAYGASAPHPIVVVGGFAESTSGALYAVVTPKTSVAETELVGCVEYAGNGNAGGGGPIMARVVRARDGIEVARLRLVSSSNDRPGIAKELDPYVRGAK